MIQPAKPMAYEIRLRGQLSETLLIAFPDLQAATDGGDTVLTGPILDQAALHGVLDQIETLGLELLGLRRVGAHVDLRVDQPRKSSQLVDAHSSP